MKTLQIGDQVPEFTSIDQHGNTIKLSGFSGKKLIVFFYPAANTPTCTTEACNLRDNYSKLKDQGFELLGVSADSVKKQASFAKKFTLPFFLLADEDHTVINIFRVWGPKKFMGKEFDGLHRVTFVLDENARVLKVIDKVVSKDHAAQLLE